MEKQTGWMAAASSLILLAATGPAQAQLPGSSKDEKKDPRLPRAEQLEKRELEFPPLLPPSDLPSVELNLQTSDIFLPWREGPWRATYVVEDGIAIWEGDIDLTEQLKSFTPTRTQLTVVRDGRDVSAVRLPLVAKADRGALWPSNTIPFEISSAIGASSPLETSIIDGIADLEAVSNLRFIPFDPDRHNARIRFVLDDRIRGAGSSPVGRQGGTFGPGENRIRLISAAGKGTVIHEILHSLGFYHEQSRADRDQFVNINLSIVRDGTTHNFDRHATNTIDFGPYDCGSLMHYGRNAFRRMGATGNVITSRNESRCPTASIGGTGALSTLDIEGLNRAYPAQDCTGAPVFYTGAFNSGRLVLDADVPELEDLGYRDKLFSVCVPNGWSVTLFNDPNYRGERLRFGPGRHLFSQENRAVAFSADSIRITGVDANPVPRECLDEVNGAVMLFEHENFRGRRMRLRRSDGDIGDSEFSFGDKASSVCVPPNWTATFFKDHRGSGDSFILEAGSGGGAVPNIKGDPALGSHFDNAIHSVSVRRSPSTTPTTGTVTPRP